MVTVTYLSLLNDCEIGFVIWYRYLGRFLILYNHLTKYHLLSEQVKNMILHVCQYFHMHSSGLFTHFCRSAILVAMAICILDTTRKLATPDAGSPGLDQGIIVRQGHLQI